MAAPAAVRRELAEDSLPPSLTASLPGHIPDRRPLHPRCHHLLCSHGHPACLFPDLHGQGKLPTWGSNEAMAACWTPGPHNLNTLAPGNQGTRMQVINSSRHSFFFPYIYLFYFLGHIRSSLLYTGSFVVVHRPSKFWPMGLVAPRHVGS